MVLRTIGIAGVAILAFGAGCFTRKWTTKHGGARSIKVGAVMAKEPKYYITFLINGSSEGFAFDTIEEAQKWASNTVGEILTAETPEEMSLDFSRDLSETIARLSAPVRSTKFWLGGKSLVTHAINLTR